MRLHVPPVSVISRIGVLATTVALRLSLLEQAHLAEEVARARARPGARRAAQHLGLALLDRHELVREVTLADEVASLLHGDLLGERGDLASSSSGTVCEQWKRLQSACVHPFSCYANAARLYPTDRDRRVLRDILDDLIAQARCSRLAALLRRWPGASATDEDRGGRRRRLRPRVRAPAARRARPDRVRGQRLRRRPHQHRARGHRPTRRTRWTPASSSTTTATTRTSSGCSTSVGRGHAAVAR